MLYTMVFENVLHRREFIRTYTVESNQPFCDRISEASSMANLDEKDDRSELIAMKHRNTIILQIRL
jgi:hypothetical protein